MIDCRITYFFLHVVERICFSCGAETKLSFLVLQHRIDRLSEFQSKELVGPYQDGPLGTLRLLSGRVMHSKTRQSLSVPFSFSFGEKKIETIFFSLLLLEIRLTRSFLRILCDGTFCCAISAGKSVSRFCSAIMPWATSAARRSRKMTLSICFPWWNASARW